MERSIVEDEDKREVQDGGVGITFPVAGGTREPGPSGSGMEPPEEIREGSKGMVFEPMGLE